MRGRRVTKTIGWLAAGALTVTLGGCGATVPVWGPESDPEAADRAETLSSDETITDAEALAAALKADPQLHVTPPPPADAAPSPAAEWLVELPAEGPAADPEVLHAWLLDLGVTRVQIESLLPPAAPDEARFWGEGDPGVLRLRLRRAPAR